MQDVLLSPISLNDLLTNVREIVKEELISERKNDLDSKEWLNSKEVKQLLKISDVTLWKYDRKGITEPHRIGKVKRYRKDQVLSVMTKMETKIS